MKSYLVTYTPLEPYFFGGERNFAFGNEQSSLKQRYFISSLDTPSQTTLLGALRYAVLAANNALISDFSKDSPDRQRAAALVGAESFTFGGENRFGTIGGIHPLFIMDGEDYLIPMPKNHRNGAACYEPMHMELCPDGITLCSGNSFFPDYEAKHGCGGGWLNLTGRSFVPCVYDVHTGTGLFQSIVQVGINANRTAKPGERDDKEGFFKKEYKRLRKGSFAFFADMKPEQADRLKSGVTVCSGQNRSAFLLKAVERENDLADKITAALSGIADGAFWYAPADCRAEQEYDGLMLAETKLFRHLIASADNRYYHRLNKTKSLYRLITAGAVFYGEKPSFTADKASQVIGMNELVNITKGG